MDERIYREYVAILKEELQPAMGCTEPIAVAYCAALARKTLGALPETVEVLASANIIKNVKSVIVPNTNGQRGIAAAAAAGIIADNADAQLQVLACLTPEQTDAVGAYLQQAAFTVRRADKDYVFDIQVRVTAGADSAFVEIAGIPHERDPYREKRHCAVSQGLSGVRQPAHHRPQSADGREHHCFCKRSGHCRCAGDAPAADRL